MSYITGVQTLAKGDREEIFFDKGVFIFATSFADPYFSNDLVWKRIALHYKDASSGQRQIVILKDDNGRGWFAPSETSRSGVWAIEKIQVFDKDGDFFTVMRSSMPTPSSFDITVNKRVAPSSAIVSFELAPEVNSDSDFDFVSTVEDAGWTKFSSNGSDAVVESGEVKFQTDAGSLNTIKIEKLLSLVNDERYILRYRLTDKQEGQAGTTNVLLGTNVTLSNDNLVWGNFDETQLQVGDQVQIDEGSVYTVSAINGLANISVSPNHTVWTNNSGHSLRKLNVPVAGIINDMSIKVLDEQNNIVVQDSQSSADGLVKEVLFKAKGVTKIVFETSGQAGFWKMDDVSVKKNPDACTIDPEEVQHYQVGFKVKLMDISTGTFLTSDIYTIEKMEGDKITFDKPIVGSYSGKSLILKFPTFSECSAAQKGLFQFVGAGY